MTLRDALAFLCEREIARKDQRRIDMSFGLAKFPFVRDITGFDFAAQPSIDRAQIRDLATGRFVANGDALKTKCLWTALGLVRPTSVEFTVQWRILVDETFSINAVLPSNNP